MIFQTEDVRKKQLLAGCSLSPAQDRRRSSAAQAARFLLRRNPFSAQKKRALRRHSAAECLRRAAGPCAGENRYYVLLRI